MIKEYWLNLPVKDLKRSKKFFTEIGFSFKTERETDTMTALVVWKATMPIMFFEEKMFENVVQNKVSDASKATELMISFDAESEKEVDEMAEKVKKARGTIFSKPQTIQGWMYGFAFSDLDGHRWNMLFMDQKNMPK
ncbi:putative lactoylglutathione lyase [Aequorivita sublithincola DSM 14238]|uniref:Putative lactoylglutathione lyase n=1 Tax=Aequorivita sublithincola (strain DSM 14238 / LMG 21431 / ACAM 643 / 9-3) TaxID=746697 RepID=I3YRZ5_AEQSU|nr:VOC family protein [Aequorivita sublithincola]AFL79763.1 putative lactoylglutathione lyase [Aequorivita sublithincola DSM 14238]